MRIKELKGEPLLTPPAKDEASWYKLSESEKRGIRGHLQRLRAEKLGYDMARLLYSMRAIGMREELSEADVDAMRRSLASERARASDSSRPSLVSTSFHRRLGLDFPPTDGEILQSKANLGWGRSESAGLPIAENLVLLNEYGVKEDCTPGDRRHIEGYFMSNRTLEIMLTMLSLMKRLRIPYEPTKQDEATMKGILESARRNNHWLRLAEVHREIREVIGPAETQESQDAAPMPPLKRFR